MKPWVLSALCAALFVLVFFFYPDTTKLDIPVGMMTTIGSPIDWKHAIFTSDPECEHPIKGQRVSRNGSYAWVATPASLTFYACEGDTHRQIRMLP